MKHTVHLYTDGGCNPNPGVGGWGYVLIHPYKEISDCGGEIESTNNRMEIQAVIEGLKRLNQPCKVVIFSDSQYVVNAINSWIHGWKKQGWKRGRKRELLNAELWIQLYDCLKEHDCIARWVKGHAGNKYNEMCDELATIGREYAEQQYLDKIVSDKLDLVI